MLHMNVMDKPIRCEDSLHLLQFTYKNEKQVALNMSLFEAIYRWKYKTLANWDNPVNRATLGLKMLKEMEQEVSKIGN